MNLLEQFKKYLFSQDNPPSKVTVKNYLSDLNHFVKWFEIKFQTAFAPEAITKITIENYKTEMAETLSPVSLQRHLSTLRKFFYFLVLENVIPTDPFKPLAIAKDQNDPWKLKEFKNFLYVYNASHLTIKNYLIDVKQFLNWAEEVTGLLSETGANIFSAINTELLEEYKKRLVDNGNFSAATVNRKLSSLRKYISWGLEEHLIAPFELGVSNYEEEKLSPTFLPEQEFTQLPKENLPLATDYSTIPTVRLIQKITKGIDSLLEVGLITHLATAVEASSHLAWKIKGHPVFDKAAKIRLPRYIDKADIFGVRNIKKEFYAPLEVSTAGLPRYKQIWLKLRHQRPKWYKTYHSYAFAHYFNFVVLIIFVAGLTLGFYNGFVKATNPSLAANPNLPTNPLRILSFQGRLTDQNSNPITSVSNLRFAIYRDSAATGAGTLLWQEVDQVAPDTDGIFNVILGNTSTVCANPNGTILGKCAIYSSLFSENNALWVGVTVESTNELTPRQQIATVAYAVNSETLQGLLPITATAAAVTNVVLALDSTGNLTIGAGAVTANPVFSANGNFTISTGTSNGNILLSSDFDSGVQIGSALSATPIAPLFVNGGIANNAALIVNNKNNGNIIAASSAGVTKFVIDSSGNISTSNYTTIGQVLYGSSAIGAISQTSGGSTGNCLTFNTGSAPTWAACSNAVNWWNQVGGLVYPATSGWDFAVGGSSTASATFAVLNNITSFPLATVAGIFTVADNLKRVNPNPIATISGNTGSVILSINNNGRGDLLTASTGGNTKFTVDTNGFLGIGGRRIIPGNTSDITLQNGDTIANTAAGTIAINSSTLTANSLATFNTAATLAFSGDITITGNDITNTTLNLGGGSAATLGTTGGQNLSIIPNAGGALNLATTNTGAVSIGNSTGAVSISGSSLTLSNGAFANCGVLNTTSNVVGCGSLPAGSANWWNQVGGLVYPTNSGWDFAVGGNSTASATFAVLNNITTFPLATVAGRLTVGDNLKRLSPTPIATISGNTGSVILSLNNNGFGDLLTASNGGNTKFTVDRNGFIGIGTQIIPGNTNEITLRSGETIDNATNNQVNLNLGTSGTLLLTSATATNLNSSTNLSINTGNAVVTTIGNTTGGVSLGGSITLSSGTYANCGLLNTTSNVIGCGSLPAGSTNWWNQVGGLVYPATSGWDFAVGGSSTASATFAVLNNITSFPLATVAGIFTVADNLKRVNPNPIATISGNTGSVILSINNNGRGDLLTASTGGNTKFTVDTNGFLGIGGTKIIPGNTSDITLRNGETIDNATDNTVNLGLAANGILQISAATTGNLTFSTAGNINAGGNLTLQPTGNIVLAPSTTNDVVFNPIAGQQLIITQTTSAPTSDMVSITNAGLGVTTAGVSNLQLTYVGGSANVESSGERIDLTPGGTSGGIWNGLRLVPAVGGPASGVTQNLIKIEGPTTNTGTTNGIIIGATNSQLFTNAINIASTGVTTDILLQNGETLDNDTDNQVKLGFGAAGGTLLLTSTTNSIINASTRLDLQVDGAVDVNIAGGSGATGCTVLNASGNLNCTGLISSNGLPLEGFWSQVGGLVYPINTGWDFAVGGTSTASAQFGIIGVKDSFVYATLAGRLTVADNLKRLSPTPIATISGNTGSVVLSLNNNGFGDLIAASRGGNTSFVVRGDAGGGRVGIGTALPASLLHIYSTGDFAHSLSIDAQGATSGQDAEIVMETLGDGTKQLTAGTLGWQIWARGNAFATASQQNDLGFSYWNGTQFIDILRFDSLTGNLGVGSGTNTIAQLQVTHPLSFGANGKSVAIFDQVENQDIFSASKSSVPKFIIGQNGEIGLGLAGGATGLQNFGNSGDCLKSGGSGAIATWLSCGGGSGVNWWNQVGGLVYPTNSGWDFAVGGNSTASAYFSIINLSTGSLVSASLAGRLNIADDLRRTSPTPIATISGRTDTVVLSVNNNGGGDLFTASRGGNTKFVITGAGQVGIGTSLPQAALDIAGSSSTISNTAGDITITPTGNLIVSSTRLGLNTNSPLSTLDVRGFSSTVSIASASGTTSFAALVVDNTGSGDLFTASHSGAPRFTIAQNGTVVQTTTFTSIGELLNFGAAPNLANGYAVTNAVGDSGSLIPNPGFESAVTKKTFADGWVVSSTSTAALIQDTSSSAKGNASAKVTTSGSQFEAFYSACVPISGVGGGTYNLYYYAKTSVTAGLITNAYLDQYTTQANCQANSGTVTVSAPAIQANRTDVNWHSNGATITPAATTTWARVHFLVGGPTSGISVNIDGVRLIQSTLAEGTDYAENYPADPNNLAQPGDLVSVESVNQTTEVKPTDKSLDDSYIGIVSTDPGQVIGDEVQQPRVPIALSGRVPTKVSTINGAIHVGDLLQASDIPGVAVKATKLGPTVAVADQNYDGTNPTNYYENSNGVWQKVLICDTQSPNCTGISKIVASIKSSYYDPTPQIASIQNLVLNDQMASDTSFTIPHYFTISDVFGQPITKIGAYLELAAGNIKVGILQATQITTNALTVASENVKINGLGIRNYIAQVVNDVLSQNNYVSPINTSAAVAIYDQATGTQVANIDNHGNASFSGTLNVGKDASISGTLHVKKIIADEIQSNSLKASTVSATNITNVTNIYSTDPFPTLPSSPSAPDNSNIFAGLLSQNKFVNIATLSSQLAYVENLNAVSATVANGLTVYGPSSLSDTSIVGQLSINGTFILNNNSINVLGSDLSLQPLRQGGLSIMAGLIYVDTQGNMSIDNNLTVKGTLFADNISSNSGGDIKIGSSSGLLTIKPSGEVIASGAGTFDKLNIGNLVGTALAVSPTEVIATGSAGVSTIQTGRTEITIDNKLVTDKSLIYITPTTHTAQPLFLLRQVPSTSFTVGIETWDINPIKFNWIIIN